MKKTLTLILSLLTVMCLLAGCSQPAEMGSTPDDMRIVAEGKEYTPIQNWIYSYEDGLAADGIRLTVQDMLDQSTDMEPIPAPFEIETDLSLDSGVYSVYDLEGNEVYYHSLIFTLPETAGDYLCVMELTYGTSKDYSGYQLFFRFSVS